MQKICDVNREAVEKLPPTFQEKSGVGTHYVDAYIKSLNAEMENGAQVVCKRKGLKIILTVGDNTGEAIMRRIEHGPDVKCILRHALETAAQEAGCQFSVEDGEVWLEV